MLSYGWQCDRDLWAKIPSGLRDSNSWSKVGFVEAEAVSVPDQAAGIYFFCTSPVGCRVATPQLTNRLFAKLFTPIYIGKTDNLKRRFLQHCKNPSGRLRAARSCFGASMEFWYHRRPLDCIGTDEAVLIRCFGPTANYRRESILGIVREPVPIGVHDPKSPQTRSEL